jgi:hypothetical protein
MSDIFVRWVCAFLIVLLVSFAGAGFVSHWNSRVWASRTSFAEIAQRFPAGSRERSLAIRAEMMRRLHPNWRDLSAAEIADRIAALGNVQNHDSRLPQVTIVFSYMSNKSPVARARAMGVPV